MAAKSTKTAATPDLAEIAESCSKNMALLRRTNTLPFYPPNRLNLSMAMKELTNRLVTKEKQLDFSCNTGANLLLFIWTVPDSIVGTEEITSGKRTMLRQLYQSALISLSSSLETSIYRLISLIPNQGITPGSKATAMSDVDRQEITDRAVDYAKKAVSAIENLFEFTMRVMSSSIIISNDPETWGKWVSNANSALMSQCMLIQLNLAGLLKICAPRLTKHQLNVALLFENVQQLLNHAKMQVVWPLVSTWSIVIQPTATADDDYSSVQVQPSLEPFISAPPMPLSNLTLPQIDPYLEQPEGFDTSSLSSSLSSPQPRLFNLQLTSEPEEEQSPPSDQGRFPNFALNLDDLRVKFKRVYDETLSSYLNAVYSLAFVPTTSEKKNEQKRQVRAAKQEQAAKERLAELQSKTPQERAQLPLQYFTKLGGRTPGLGKPKRATPSKKPTALPPSSLSSSSSSASYSVQQYASQGTNATDVEDLDDNNQEEETDTFLSTPSYYSSSPSPLRISDQFSRTSSLSSSVSSVSSSPISALQQSTISPNSLAIGMSDELYDAGSEFLNQVLQDSNSLASTPVPSQNYPSTPNSNSYSSLSTPGTPYSETRRFFPTDEEYYY
jgi:hypothetical protein